MTNSFWVDAAFVWDHMTLLASLGVGAKGCSLGHMVPDIAVCVRELDLC